MLVPAINREEIVLEEEIGRGSCGVVYRGTCRHVQVAVKELNAIEGDEEHSRFWLEVSIMLQIRHPNVVNIMGACTNPKNCLIVTEYLPNKDLQYMLDKCHKNKETIDPLYALKFAHDIASGMHWLHCSQPKIIHRDLKPANVLIDQYNNAKIADFGLSIVNQEKEKLEKKLTGSPLWMAPEALEMKPVDEKIDIYGFSIILYQLLTTSPIPYDLTPFKKNFPKFLAAITTQNLRPQIPSSIPSSLSDLLTEGWHQDPAKRPTFHHILSQLGEIRCSMALRSDVNATSLWLKNFGDTDKVKVDQFCKVIYDFLDEDVPDPETKDEVQYQKYKCLLTICRDETAHIDQNRQGEKVPCTTLTRFGLLLVWFGPLQKQNATIPGFLERIYHTMKEHWFHGDISRESAVGLLTTAAETNLNGWLVRTSDQPSHPFTLSRIINKDKNPEFNHMRIAYNAAINKYQLEIKTTSNKKDKKVEKSSSSAGNVKLEGYYLSEIINQSSTLLYLKKKHIVSRKQYSDIFVNRKIAIANTFGYSDGTTSK
uniref:Protein kinase domain-containing protein n=1 Tax=Arcella intermedia TaxID=1963864 RepID=A0A6B2L1A0_9EUKA